MPNKIFAYTGPARTSVNAPADLDNGLEAESVVLAPYQQAMLSERLQSTSLVKRYISKGWLSPVSKVSISKTKAKVTAKAGGDS